MGGIGFLYGYIIQDVSVLRDQNIVTNLVIVIVITAILYLIFFNRIVFQIYDFWISLREFMEWRQLRYANNNVQQEFMQRRHTTQKPSLTKSKHKTNSFKLQTDTIQRHRLLDFNMEQFEHSEEVQSILRRKRRSSEQKRSPSPNLRVNTKITKVQSTAKSPLKQEFVNPIGKRNGNSKKVSLWKRVKTMLAIKTKTSMKMVNQAIHKKHK